MAFEKLRLIPTGERAATTSTERSPSSGRELSARIENNKADARQRATLAADRLFAWCLLPDVGDPKVYLAGVVAIFEEYPRAVTDAIADPRSATRLLKNYPSLQDLRQACDDLNLPNVRAAEREGARGDALLDRPIARTAQQQAAIDAQITSWRRNAGVPAEGLRRRGAFTREPRWERPIGPSTLADLEARKLRNQQMESDGDAGGSESGP